MTAARLRELARWLYGRVPGEDVRACDAGAAALEAQAQREGEIQRLREALDALAQRAETVWHAHSNAKSADGAYPAPSESYQASMSHSLNVAVFALSQEIRTARAALSPAGTAKEGE